MRRFGRGFVAGCRTEDGSDFFGHRLGVFDAAVVDGAQAGLKGFGDELELPEGDVTIVELPFGEALRDDGIDEFVDGGGGGGEPTRGPPPRRSRRA